MFNLTTEEITIIIDALNMALASNKRMQTAKPKFDAVFRTIHNDIVQLQNKLLSPPTKQK